MKDEQPPEPRDKNSVPGGAGPASGSQANSGSLSSNTIEEVLER